MKKNDIDKVLSEKELKYKNIQEFLKERNEEIYYKILYSITKFTERDRKKVCKTIIANTNNEDVINQVCMQIITFIQYNYEYYKEISEIIAIKKLNGIWVNELIYKMICDYKNTLVYVFDDFSKEIPQNTVYDIQIITRFLDRYNEKYLEVINMEKKNIIEFCKRLNYIMTINIKNILRVFYFFSINYKLKSEEYSSFLETFFSNYPSICKEFIKSSECKNVQNDFVLELSKKVIQHDDEEKLKYSMEIFKPDIKRMNEYGKYLAKQNRMINKDARNKSLFVKLTKQNTILYGRRYGIPVIRKESSTVSIGNLQEFKYEYPYPIEFILDPVEYLSKVNSIKLLGRRNKKCD